MISAVAGSTSLVDCPSMEMKRRSNDDEKVIRNPHIKDRRPRFSGC